MGVGMKRIIHRKYNDFLVELKNIKNPLFFPFGIGVDCNYIYLL
jgi:hypothetical protein